MRLTMRHNRGVSSIIALLFMVLILIMGVGTYFWISWSTHDYRLTLCDMERIDFNRGLEDLIIVGNPFNQSDYINMTVHNSGSIDTEIAWITVVNPETGEPIMEYTDTEGMWLRPHQNRTITDIDHVFSGGYQGTNSYKIQLVTTRGTKIEHQFPRPVPPPPEIMTLFIGPFYFDFNAQSFNFSSSIQIEPHGAWEMRDDAEEIMFWIKVTNYGEESIEVKGLSYLELIVHEVEDACTPTESGCFESEIYFYIVDSNSTSDNLVAYSTSDPVTVESGETTLLKFAAKQAYGNSFNDPGVLQGYPGHANDPGTENLLWSFIALYWEYEGTERVYGKTIPFTAVHLTPYEP